MRKGQIVVVEGFDHEFIQCRFVRLQGQTAIVCGEEEWLLAEKENRDPVCIGFPLKNVRDRAWMDSVRLAAKDKPYTV